MHTEFAGQFVYDIIWISQVRVECGGSMVDDDEYGQRGRRVPVQRRPRVLTCREIHEY